MRGHIVKRYKNSYTIVLDVGRDPVTGKRRQQWVSVKGTKKDAEKRMADLIHQLDTGTFIKPGKTTFGDFLEMWLQDYRSNLSPRGYERYHGLINKHLIPELGKFQLVQLRPEHLQKHYAAKLNGGLNPRTIRYHHAIIHIALATAVKWGLVARNVADIVDPPKFRRTEMKTWDLEEMSKFLEAIIESPYYTLFYLALFTGMRRSELLGLQWKDIDLLLSQVSVNRSLHHLKDGSYIFSEPKSEKSRRMISLPPSAVLLLKKHWETQVSNKAILGFPITNDGLVFSQPDGRPLRPNTVTRAWATACRQAGVKIIRLHDARHTHASLMLKQGIHPKIVQERLGHSSIAMTLDVYSHVSPGLQEAAARKFDEMLPIKREKEAFEKVG